MAVARNPRAGIDDRWHKRVKGPDGAIRKERSALYGEVSRWRVRWVDGSGDEHSKVFVLKEAAQSSLDKVTVDVVKGQYVSPRHWRSPLKRWRKNGLTVRPPGSPRLSWGYSWSLDTLILPRWGTWSPR